MSIVSFFMIAVFDKLFCYRAVRYALVLFGILGIADTLYLFFVYDILHLGVVLPLVVGVLFLLHGLCWQKIVGLLKKFRYLTRIWQFIWFGFLLWLCSFVVFVGYLQDSLNNQQDFINKPVKAIIVLGSGFRDGKPTPVLASRLDLSAVVARKNPDAWLVLTGGVGFNKTQSEASVMQRYLLERYALPLDKMLLEDKSTSTELNLQNSKQILANYQVFADSPIVVVSSDFHTLRAVLIAKKQGFSDVVSVGAVTPLYVRYNNWVREYFAFVSGWVLNEY